jgi:hypothetical protein
MTEQCWVAVDGHGNEYIFSRKPWRDFPNLDLRVKWGQNWISDPEPNMDKRIKLPKGTVELLTGRALTYSNEPVLLEFEDYGNYVETRPEVLNPEPDTWPSVK